MITSITLLILNHIAITNPNPFPVYLIIHHLAIGLVADIFILRILWKLGK